MVEKENFARVLLFGMEGDCGMRAGKGNNNLPLFPHVFLAFRPLEYASFCEKRCFLWEICNFACFLLQNKQMSAIIRKSI